MFLLLISFVSCSLFRFNDEKIPKNTIIRRYFDMNRGFLSLNLSITKCDGNCELEIVAFEEVRRKQIFHEKDNFQPFCCTPERNCLNTIDFADTTPVIRRPILIKTISDSSSPEHDILLEKAVTLSYIDLSSFQSSNIELPRKGIWTIMIANCGENDINIDGNATILRKSGFLDDRLKYNSSIFMIQLVFGISYLVYFTYSVWNNAPHLDKDHIKVMTVSCIFAFDGLVSFLFFYLMNIVVDIPNILTVFVALVHSISIVSILYSVLSALQRPVEIPLFKFALLIIPFFFASFNDLNGYVSFNERSTGKWIFGVGKIPYMFFLSYLIVHASIAVYAYLHKPSESLSGDKRFKFLGMFVGILFGYLFMSLSLFVIRLNSSIIATRKSEWVPLTIIPIILLSLIIANGWFVMDFNTEGWVVLETAPAGSLDVEHIPSHDSNPFD